jgi:hypothetical protein
MMPQWQMCDRRFVSDPQPWTARLPDGRELLWSGFFTGPIVLSTAEIENAAIDLLDISTSAIAALAAQELHPYISGAGPEPPSMLIHSATTTTKGFEGDLDNLIQGRSAHDVATYLETRCVFLGRPGDIAVGRTRPWRESALRAGILYVDIGDVEHYYLSQALLRAALRHMSAPVPAINKLLDWLHSHPDTVVRLYALDREMQIFLLWLKRRAGLSSLLVDANNPVVSGFWNQKTHIHPSPGAAHELHCAEGLDAAELLSREQQQSTGYQRLGLAIPVLPGYLILRDDGQGSFNRELLDAAQLLRDRYEIRYGCLKPCEAGDGARIVPRIDLTDSKTLLRHAHDAYPYGDHYILEAQVDFLQYKVGPHSFDLAPSGHIRGGHVAAGLTEQTMNGCSWAGNALFDERMIEMIGISQAQYAQMTAAMHAVRNAFYSERSIAEGCYQGLVTGGVDFAVGRIGGRFGERVMIGAIDFNLSSHGAEYMRAFQDAVQADQPDAYVATRVYRPAGTATLEATEEVTSRRDGDRCAGVVCCVPGRWGMIACSGTDTSDAILAALDVVTRLADEQLADLFHDGREPGAS